MHDTDGISSHRRVKNSTLLRSRVEFQIKSFCFFTVYLTGGHIIHRTTVAVYEIKAINGTEYLFMEWKMGNYIYGGKEPDFYVFVRA